MDASLSAAVSAAAEEEDDVSEFEASFHSTLT